MVGLGSDHHQNSESKGIMVDGLGSGQPIRVRLITFEGGSKGLSPSHARGVSTQKKKTPSYSYLNSWMMDLHTCTTSTEK